MHPILIALKPIAEKLIMTKVVKEVNRGFKNIQKTTANDDREVIEIVDTIETAVVSKKKVSAWSAVAIAVAYYASSQGLIDPALADLINTLLSNPEVVEGIESVVE